MFKGSRLFLAAIIVALMLTACAVSSGSSDPTTVIVTPAIKGNTVSLNVGDTLELQIPTIPSAGYNWVPQSLDTTILAQVGEAVYTASSDANSAGGLTTLKFNAVGKGTVTLNLLYENGALSSNSFSVVVEVK